MERAAVAKAQPDESACAHRMARTALRLQAEGGTVRRQLHRAGRGQAHRALPARLSARPWASGLGEAPAGMWSVLLAKIVCSA